jgi:hypothetical protein
MERRQEMERLERFERIQPGELPKRASCSGWMMNEREAEEFGYGPLNKKKPFG